MKTKALITNRYISEKELPYTLFSVLTTVVMLFYIPVILLPPISDSLTAVIFGSGVFLMLTGILFFNGRWRFWEMVIIIFVQNFAIFWAAYRYGRSAGSMLFYFPCMVAYMYMFLYNPGKIKTAVKVGIITISFIASIFFTGLSAQKFAHIPDSFAAKVYNINLLFSVVATLAVLVSLYYHFVRLHRNILGEQHKQHRQELREIDMQHEKEEYSLLLSLRDDIAQTLVTSRMFMQMVPGQPELVKKADEGVKDAINGLNNISLELSPAMLIDLGFENGISVYAELLSKKLQLPIHISLEKTEHELDDISRLSLFRIIRQCIEIIAAEGAVTYIKVYLHCNDKVCISMEHDSELYNFAEIFQEKDQRDLSKRLDYYEAVLHEQKGKINMLLDIQCANGK